MTGELAMTLEDKNRDETLEVMTGILVEMGIKTGDVGMKKVGLARKKPTHHPWPSCEGWASSSNKPSSSTTIEWPSRTSYMRGRSILQETSQLCLDTQTIRDALTSAMQEPLAFAGSLGAPSLTSILATRRRHSAEQCAQCSSQRWKNMWSARKVGRVLVGARDRITEALSRWRR